MVYAISQRYWLCQLIISDVEVVQEVIICDNHFPNILMPVVFQGSVYHNIPIFSEKNLICKCKARVNIVLNLEMR